MTPAGPADLRDTWLRELLPWLRSLGCCTACALWIALVAVARAFNEAPPAGPRVPCGAHRHRRDVCDGYARDAWKTRPQRPQIQEPRKAA